jgi:Ankyrin repeats (many copies)
MMRTRSMFLVLCLSAATILFAAVSVMAQSDATRRLYVATSGGFELNEAAANNALKAGADINWQNPGMTGETMLIMAIKGFKDPSMVKFLIDHGADATIKDDKGKTALDWALQYNLGKDRNGREILAMLEAASGVKTTGGNTAGGNTAGGPKNAPVQPTKPHGPTPQNAPTPKGAPSAAEIKEMIEEKMTINYEHHFWGTGSNEVSFNWMGPIQVVGTDVRGSASRKCWNTKLDVKITIVKPSTGETSSVRRGIEGTPIREMFCIWRDTAGKLDFVTYQP